MKTKHSESERKELLATHLLYSFIAAALALIVPLYLLQMEVDIAMVGLILSVGPLTFMTVRIFFAAIADDVGTKAITMVYSVSNILAVLLYLLVLSPLGFASATLAEGVRTSGFWAVARTQTMEFNGRHRRADELAMYSNVRQLGDGLGRLLAGVLLAYFAFQGSFLLVLALSAALLGLALLSRESNSGPMRLDGHLLKRIFKRRDASFWQAALLQLSVWVPFNMLMAFLLPLYLVSALGMDYLEVGAILALLSICTAAVTFIMMRLRFSKKALLVLTALNAPILMIIPFTHVLTIPMMAMLAIGMGCGNIIGEYLLTDQMVRHKGMSTNIGVIYVPSKIAEFLFLSLGGLTIAGFGFTPLFFVLAGLLILFALLGMKFISHHPVRTLPPRVR
ncbi:MAG: MFS transporter [Candidatus Micrarchaeota archaeon]